MGLDMYLNAKRYMFGFRDEDNEQAKAVEIMFPELAKIKSQWGEDKSVVKAVEVEVGYWRKANAIHRWFVDNVQEGKDDCGNYYVSREQLEELKHLCTTVLENPDDLGSKLLPTASGFFFGGTEYGEHYKDDLAQTVRIIEDCLALPESWDIEYHSSW